MNPEALWSTIQNEARAERELTPQLAGYLDGTVLQHATLGAALAYQLSVQLTKYDSALTSFRPQFEAMIGKYQIEEAASADLFKVASSNPACPNALSAFLSFRGFQSFQLHRIAHRYWHEGKTTLAVLLQNWGAQIYNVDIHPAAKVGKGLFVDHAMGIVVGETAVIEDDVSIWHGVTLGSTFSESGDRHPKIRRGATLAVGAIILGNIEIGEGAVIAAGSVVLQSIPPGMVAAGVPAKVIKSAAAAYAAITTQKRQLKEHT